MNEQLTVNGSVSESHYGKSAPRVLVIMGHYRVDSFCAALAEAYLEGARDAGAEVHCIRVVDMDFEPNVLEASPCDQPIEESIAEAMALVSWAEHMVFVFPTWWGTMPALLKGFLDRVLMPGFAFEFRDDGEGWEKFLQGKSAHLLTTMDTPPFVYKWIYGSPGLNGLARATLGFCGIKPVRRTVFGSVKDSSARQRREWLEQAYGAGKRLETGVLTPREKVLGEIGAWLAALRLHFYPMVWGAFGVGTLTGSQTSGTVDMAAFWLGLACLFTLEIATVFTNEVADWESDRRNTHAGPFTGGSRVLVEGRLRRKQLIVGAILAMAATGMFAWLLPASSPVPFGVLAILAVLAIGYTAPPFKLCWRGLGELDVAITHSILVLIFGHLLQGGHFGDPLPWLLGLPMLFSILPAITLSGIPDHDADKLAGKRTVAVILGPVGAVRFAQANLVLSVFSAIALMSLESRGDIFGWLALFAAPHAVLVFVSLERYLDTFRTPGRIDGLMALSLLYILWFVVVPLVRLLAPP